MHRRLWICGGVCKLKLPAKRFFIQHLRAYHSNLMTEHQLPIFVEMSERPINGDEIMACPLCQDELYPNRLQGHVAEHLEELAPFVLPTKADDDGDMGSEKAPGAAPSSMSMQSRDVERHRLGHDHNNPHLTARSKYSTLRISQSANGSVGIRECCPWCSIFWTAVKRLRGVSKPSSQDFVYWRNSFEDFFEP
jgi:hypothetical protein